MITFRQLNAGEDLGGPFACFGRNREQWGFPAIPNKASTILLLLD